MAVSLRMLLETHDTSTNTRNIIPQAIGDGYLYEHNEIFKNLRDAFLKLGGRYDVNPPFDYFSFPLIALPEILEQKIVPVVNNVSWLKKLELQYPNFFKLSDFQTIRPHKNFLAHETSHCLGQMLLIEKDANRKKSPDPSIKEQIVKIMLGESFANTTETLISGYLRPKKSAQEIWFLEQNLYIPYATKGLSKLIKQVGLKQTAKLGIILFLYSNFLCTKMAVSEHTKIFDLIELDGSIRKDKSFQRHFLSLKGLALGLDPTFRAVTGSLYLKRLGYSQGLGALLNFDPIRLIKKTPKLQLAIDQMAGVLSGDF